MKTIVTAIALTIAIPAVAFAQSGQAPAPKADCCEKMKTMADCKDMAMTDHGKMMGHDLPMAGHDMSKMGAETPKTDAPTSPRS